MQGPGVGSLRDNENFKKKLKKNNLSVGAVCPGGHLSFVAVFLGVICPLGLFVWGPFVLRGCLSGGHLSAGAVCPGGCLSLGAVCPGGHLSVGAFCPRGCLSVGAVCPGGHLSVGAVCPGAICPWRALCQGAEWVSGPNEGGQMSGG